MSRKSAFAKWASKQFGPRPSKQSWSILEKDAATLEQAARRARRLADEVWRYDDRLNAALYGWQAGPGVEARDDG